MHASAQLPSACHRPSAWKAVVRCRGVRGRVYPARRGLFAAEAIELLRTFYVAGNPAGVGRSLPAAMHTHASHDLHACALQHSADAASVYSEPESTQRAGCWPACKAAAVGKRLPCGLREAVWLRGCVAVWLREAVWLTEAVPCSPCATPASEARSARCDGTRRCPHGSQAHRARPRLSRPLTLPRCGRP